ncbi:N-acetylmuramoyl-L-alanine amidase [Clostridium frigidicarnis]|uniref:Glucan-binding repeat-containing protein n=1 Tax=Clostridium frigidicarnis TaxID=84698 RepID=A0A1I0VVF8_9CLOT|nr:N-acetylmuramoyl-L-alanine amidase [Clostridium frigidicarnis]SFA80361.1 glucan-binding repeat-containing protein [Clostridium frigidicarnis]
MIRRLKKGVCWVILMSLFINPSITTFAQTENSSKSDTQSTYSQKDVEPLVDSKDNINNVDDSAKNPTIPSDNKVDVSKSSSTMNYGWWVQTDNNWFYVSDNNVKSTGWKQINNYWYYFDKNGVMLTGWQLIDGAYYYLRFNGSMATGWIKPDNVWYYLKDDGSMVTGLHTISDKKYYFNNNGDMQVGWQQINDKWYYFDCNNGNMCTGWIWTSTGWYYLNADGIMATGWIKLGQDWYYLNQNGTMLTGWQTIGGQRYYLRDNGSMAETWEMINGKWYYFKQGSGSLLTGWLFLGNVWYYLLADGSMAIGTHKIDGVNYYFDSNGVWNPEGVKKLVVVDPGHNHGGDYGSEKYHDGIKYSETELDMQVALRVKTQLESKGYDVKLTREESDRFYDDLSVSLMKRYSLANNSDAKLFVSLHHDVSDNSTVQGISTHYSTYRPNIDNEGVIVGDDPNGWYSGVYIDTTPCEAAVKSKKLAETIATDLSFQMGYNNRKAHDHNLSVTVNTNMPSLLIECGFISNKDEAERANNFKNQENIGKIVSSAVESIIK